MILRANELFLQYDYLYQRGMEKCPIYSPRDVIVIKEYQTPVEESELSLAIVLGAIAKGDELRTDCAGMTGYNDIVRHATWEDLDNPSISRGFAVSNRVIQEVDWYCLEQMSFRKEGTLYAFDTYGQCMRYLEHEKVPRPHPCRLTSKPDANSMRHDFVEIDLLESFREEDQSNAIALKKKYGDANAYKIALRY